MNQQAPASDLDSQLCGAAVGFGEETRSKTLAFVVDRHAKAGKQR